MRTIERIHISEPRRLTTFLLDLHLYLCSTHIRIGYKSVKPCYGSLFPHKGQEVIASGRNSARVQGLAFSSSEGDRCFWLPIALHHQSGLVRLEISEAVLTSFSHITKSPYKNTPKQSSTITSTERSPYCSTEMLHSKYWCCKVFL